MAKKTRKKNIKPVKKAKPNVKPVVLAQVEEDEDLRTILNKSDFDKYELDNYLNDFSV